MYIYFHVKIVYYFESLEQYIVKRRIVSTDTVHYLRKINKKYLLKTIREELKCIIILIVEYLNEFLRDFSRNFTLTNYIGIYHGKQTEFSEIW